MASLPCSYLHCQPIFFRAHDESLGSAGALSWELDPFHVLAKAIYRLSNNLVHAGPWQKPRSEDGLLYNVLFSRIPPSVFSVYLGIDIISTRVAWTELLDWSVAKKDFHHAVQLVGLALDHNPKLWEKMYASRFQVLQELSMCPSGTRDRGIELLTALGLESWELSKTSLFSWVKCLEQLPEGGGPEELGNAVRYLQRCRARTCSIMKITSGQAVVTIEFRRDTAIQVSDGDALSETELRSGEIARLATIGQVTWTYLTASHQRDQCRFHAFKASLEALQDDLVDYLKRNGRFSFLPSGLLTKIEDNPSWWTVLGRCAVDLQTERCPCPRADRWQNPLAAWEHGLAFGAVEYMRQTKGAPAAVRWLETLIGRGATICPWMLATAVSGDGWLDGLIKLQALGANMRQHGQQAMVVATRLGDRRAIDWLLEQGIDINSTVPVPETDQGHRQSIGTEDVTIVYAAAFLMAYRGKPALLEMIEYLAARGARLAQYASVSSSITFVTRLLLNQMAQRGSKANNRKRHVPSMMRLVDTVKPNSKAPSDLLTACFKSGEWDLATQLLDRNTPPSTTALASAIFNAAPTLLTQRLLDDARMDFNANNGSPHPKNIPLHVAASVFDLSLIQELVAQGADLGCATEGGLTPLVSACQGQTDSALDAERRMDVVHYLLKHGLDVNAGATRSPSALGYAARAGDLELAITLLDHGADCNGRCDLDVVDGVGYIEYPLDHAAIEGRLDMVQLLLNVGAKSGQPGQTGYDGAIERAYYAEHEEIARLIQRYAGNSMSNDE